MNLKTVQTPGNIPRQQSFHRFDPLINVTASVLLALLPGFILQQAWEPELDTKGYLKTATHLINSVVTMPKTKPNGVRTRTVSVKRKWVPQIR